jgi:biopolymer transport protein ExbB
VILLLSIYMVATVVRMFMELRPEVFTPVALLEEAEKLLQGQDFMGLYKRLKADNAFFATTLTAGISELQVGLSEAREAVERVGEVNQIALERKISMLAVCGTLGPMIGLLGTLKGMIASFSVIAMSDTQLKASQVAGGISEALVLTFEGVALSVPAIYFYALFKNRITSFSAATMLEADAFLRRLYAAMKTKAAGGTSASSAPKA